MRAKGWLMAGGALGTVLLAGAAVCLGSGCSTVGFYAQAAAGHVDLMRRARPVADLIADKAAVTAADSASATALRERLLLSQRMRDFAVAELALPDNDSYRRYADLQRDAAVWNVVAAPALSLTLTTWCFPVMGCVGYRGYFGRSDADAMAAQLAADKLEVSVYGVPAYSTLGYANWLGGDPLLNTFIRWPEAELARLIFHELAHQVAYAADDTTFNESFAVAVERIGGRRWMARHALDAARAEAAAGDARRDDFRALTQRTRAALESLYSGSLDDTTKLARKAELMAAMRADHQALKAGRWAGFAGYDGWFARANNATFGVMAAYNELVPQFEALFERSGSDFARFYDEVKVLAALPKDQRRAKLAASP